MHISKDILFRVLGELMEKIDNSFAFIDEELYAIDIALDNSGTKYETLDELHQRLAELRRILNETRRIQDVVAAILNLIRNQINQM